MNIFLKDGYIVLFFVFDKSPSNLVKLHQNQLE